VLLLIAGALTVTLLGTQPPPVSEALWRVSPHELPNMFARWDTFFYYSIATRGYAWNPALFTYQNVVFFPLYPMLMRWCGALIGGHPMLAGVGISLTAFAGALAVLYRLALLELGREYAWRVILLIAVFPYALFFSAAYTESLFLLLTVTAFYAMRRGRLEWAAICGLLAGLTRPNGFWLSVPLACLVLLPAGRSAPETGEDDSMPAGLLAACTPVLGAAIFCAYLRMRFGDPLAWVHGQSAWGMPLLGLSPAPDPIALPSTLKVQAIEWIVYAGNIGAFAAAAAAIRPVMRRCGFAYGIWIAVNLLPPLVEHLFMSMGRFVSVLFPVFLWMALRIPRERLWPIAAVFTAAQVLLAVWFFLWWGVF
jgi:Mannosyltransferase (PIG-V)